MVAEILHSRVKIDSHSRADDYPSFGVAHVSNEKKMRRWEEVGVVFANHQKLR